MATSSRVDKGKATMEEQEDIGTEEGELLDVHPPLPEPTRRSGSNRKRKKHAREEEGPLARAVLPAAEEEKRAKNARKKAEKDKNYRQNSIFRHRCKEFENWTEDAVLQKGEKPLLIIPGLTMRNDEEKKKWKRTAELWAQWFQPPKSIKDHACTSAKDKACAGHTHRVGIIDEELVPVLGAHDVVHYALKIWHGEKGGTKVHEKCIREMMAIPESHPAIIRLIGLSKDKKRPMLLFPLWNGGTLEKYINLEKRSRGRISPEGLRLTNEEFRATVTSDEWLNIEIFRKHRLQIAGTMVAGLKSMHLHKWLHCDIHWQNVLLHFPSWDWDEMKSRADSGRDNENRLLSPLIRRSMVFVGIGDLGWAQSFEEMRRNTSITEPCTREVSTSLNAAEVHGRLLREGLEKMTWKKICHPFRNQRQTMDYWAHYFNEQLFIDLVTCARPIEYGPRAKVHPDGRQKVSRG
ncbi:hypothetical protein R1sor_002170 [Riccia sorocarpa]|uniref:Protein kinase domain-containing protein n=1 Tax=Riccia sorocarpa TaxID=122646 RepID=A0ABD3GYD8_9MARC